MLCEGQWQLLLITGTQENDDICMVSGRGVGEMGGGVAALGCGVSGTAE